MINLKGRSLLTLSDFSEAEIGGLLDLSAELKEKKRGGVYEPLLAHKNIALIFEKLSTRTRCAFSVACNDEGANHEFLSSADIHLGTKESVEDTARVLGRMFDGIAFRGFKRETVEKLAKYSGKPVWNALTDDDHPTQALADLLTLKERFGTLSGLKLTFVGDGRNNMVTALMIACAKCGVNFTVAAPAELFPNEQLVTKCAADARATGAIIRVTSDLYGGVEGADAIYTDVWVSMGEESLRETRIKLLSTYQVNKAVMDKASERCIFLHCLPAVKGQEVTEDVFEAHADVLFDEAENRLHTIKAVMVATIGCTS